MSEPSFLSQLLGLVNPEAPMPVGPVPSKLKRPGSFDMSKDQIPPEMASEMAWSAHRWDRPEDRRRLFHRANEHAAWAGHIPIMEVEEYQGLTGIPAKEAYMRALMNNKWTMQQVHDQNKQREREYTDRGLSVPSMIVDLRDGNRRLPVYDPYKGRHHRMR